MRLAAKRNSGGAYERHTKKIFSGRGGSWRGTRWTEQESASSGRKTHGDASARGESWTRPGEGRFLADGDAGLGGPAARTGWRREGLPPCRRAGEEKNRAVQDYRRVGLQRK